MDPCLSSGPFSPSGFPPASLIFYQKSYTVSPRIHRINQHSDTIYRANEGAPNEGAPNEGRDQRTYVHGFFDAIDIDINLHRPFTWLLMQVRHVLHNASAYLGSWEIEY